MDLPRKSQWQTCDHSKATRSKQQAPRPGGPRASVVGGRPSVAISSPLPAIPADCSLDFGERPDAKTLTRTCERR